MKAKPRKREEPVVQPEYPYYHQHYFRKRDGCCKCGLSKDTVARKGTGKRKE